MQLRNRISLIVLPAMAILAVAFGLTSWLSGQRWTQRYDQALQTNLQLAWGRLQSENLERLDEVAQDLIQHQPAFQDMSDAEIQRQLDDLVKTIAGHIPGVRIDVVNPSGRLLATTAIDLDPQPLAEAGWIKAAMAHSEGMHVLGQVAPRRFGWIAVRRFGRGAVVVGQDVSPSLPELASFLGGDVFLLNMRGMESQGTHPGLLAGLRVPIPVRSPQVLLQGQARQDGNGNSTLQLVSQPVAGSDQRIVGALVWAQDVSRSYRADLLFNFAVTGAALIFVIGLALTLLAYLRHTMNPLTRSVGVLQALANGSTDVALDEGDEDAEDEAGSIARAATSIRSELINLETLQQERIRLRRQQERLIRNQLRSLADSLDPSSRQEILEALGASSGTESSTRRTAVPADQLTELAGILGRMSGLVSTQQSRLLKLLRELQEAMQSQALLASLQQELEIARQMQLSILPRALPDTPNVDIAATMIPAKMVGGDFYDYFLIDEQHLAVVVADVSGKGVPAAFFMAISRTLLKSSAFYLKAPGATISALNDQLCSENDQMMFVTVFYGVLDLSTGQFTYVNAGHNPPLLLGHGTPSYFPKGTNMALAVMEGQNYAEGHLVLQPGETLLLYTDGVTEAINSQGLFFGEATLQHALQTDDGPTSLNVHQASAVTQHVVQAIRSFESGAPQADDITVVALTYKGPQ